ncbi:hypothetical protein DPMN_034935 [Dreissena polymorpha]|uniref:Uncharacterized protein n=1 Tax=Dreissena polymorpha TaxID=45954 RepID=A0A9D4RLF2_DREPO|nr:hypothetical protein DPMN_034935 [Dreissena polymorpha]
MISGYLLAGTRTSSRRHNIWHGQQAPSQGQHWKDSGHEEERQSGRPSHHQ